MKKVERVFAFLGLAWVINLLFSSIFPGAWLSCYVYFQDFWLTLLGAGSKQGVVRFAVSVSMILMGFLAGVVIVWGIKKVQWRRG
jgi:hypothetical protein